MNIAVELDPATLNRVVEALEAMLMGIHEEIHHHDIRMPLFAKTGEPDRDSYQWRFIEDLKPKAAAVEQDLAFFKCLHPKAGKR